MGIADLKPEDIYMHTASGVKVFPFNMKPHQVDIESIAHHLACVARWQGATKHRFLKDRIFYSVAEHSVYVSDYVMNELGRPDLALQALMHDAPEAYIGDMIRPLKYSPAFHDVFKELEDKVWKAIATRFDLPVEMAAEVKMADDAICMAEWVQIVPRDPNEQWGYAVVKGGTPVQAAQIGINMLSPIEARDMFMDRWNSLTSRQTWADTHGKIALLATG